MKELFLLCMAVCLWTSPSLAGIATFDDLSLALQSYWNGEDKTGFGSFGGFLSGENYFNNYKTDYPGWEYWDGFAYSNTTDISLPETANQFSAQW